MPFPPTWPTYIPKDKLAGWFESYVESLELNFWTGTEFVSGRYDERDGRWTVMLRRADGSRREMHPRHVVLATGVSGIPNIPDIPSLPDFGGTVLHSSQYDDGDAWKGKSAIVVGTGNSGHDIAQDLHSSRAKVTLVQRSPTLIVNVEPSAQLPYALYDEGPSLEDCDLITVATPLAVGKETHALLTERARQLDKELLDGLERIGFKLDFGEDGTGWQFKYLTRGGGYYFNVGCSDLLVEGAIRLLQFADIDRFVRTAHACAPASAGGRSGRAGDRLQGPGATGPQTVRRRVAERVGRSGVRRRAGTAQHVLRTPQPGLWFIAGSLAQCRIYSKYLALQIKALELGMLGDGRSRPDSEKSAARAAVLATAPATVRNA
jgi:putative flavoprotein involved in K+ transport